MWDEATWQWAQTTMVQPANRYGEPVGKVVTYLTALRMIQRGETEDMIDPDTGRFMSWSFPPGF